MKKPEIIIIGAGIGGLAASIQLASRGFHVTVLEKNSQPGGKILQIKKNGYVFDAGASFITLPQVYETFFKSVNRKRSEYFQWEKMQDTTTFHFYDNTTFTLSSNPEVVRARIKEMFPGNEKGFDEFIKIGTELYHVLYEKPGYAKRNYHSHYGFGYLLDPQIISHLSTLRIWQSWESLVNSLFSDEHLRLILSYQSTFVGMPPNRARALYAFLTWAEIVQGMYLVRGGVYSIVEGFYKLALELGVDFRFDQEVTRLHYKRNIITKVCASTNDYTADYVISNTDGAWFYTHLMPKEKNKYFTEAKLQKMHHTNSYFTINLGIKNPLPHINTHTFYVGKSWKDFFKIVFEKNSVPKIDSDNLCYYLIQNSRYKPSSTPHGKDSLFILIPVPGYDPEFDWNSYEQTFKTKIYDVMETRDQIPIRKIIDEEIVYSPARWGSEFNLWNNIILSFSLDFFQINNFRMPNKSREFTNLYFAGSSTIPGPGIPPCITSGVLVADRLCEDLHL